MSTSVPPPSTPSGGNSDPELVARLRIVTWRLYRTVLRQRALSEVTPSQLSALATLGERGPLRLGELAEAERIAAPSMSRIVTGLVERELTAKAPDPLDRRAFRLELTDAGREVLSEVRKMRHERLARQLEALSEEQFATLEAALPVLEQLVAEP